MNLSEDSNRQRERNRNMDKMTEMQMQMQQLQGGIADLSYARVWEDTCRDIDWI